MTAEPALLTKINNHFIDKVQQVFVAADGLVTVELNAKDLITVCEALKTEPEFSFEQLVDVCGLDYLHYGVSEWRTEETTLSGFSRATNQVLNEPNTKWDKPRFAVVYHLLSVKNNQRLRIRVFPEDEQPSVPSVISIWESANWYEREAFDLFGIIFDGHPDLRRLLTDYGFVGHPFRKDFPLIGQVELRYDAEKQSCVYEPVSIQPRVLVPKVIREDNRYIDDNGIKPEERS